MLRTQVDVVLPDGYAVLNADCPEVAQMASLSDGGVILFGESLASDPVVSTLPKAARP